MSGVKGKKVSGKMRVVGQRGSLYRNILNDNFLQVLDLRKKGLTVTQIAKLFDTTKQSVSRVFQRHQTDLRKLDHYQANKAAVYDYHAMKLLESVTSQDRKDMSGYQKYGSFGIINTHANLAHGKATSITASVQAFQDKADLRAAPDIIDVGPEKEDDK